MNKNSDKFVNQTLTELSKVNSSFIRLTKDMIVLCELYAMASGPITGIKYVKMIKQLQFVLSTFGEPCY